MRSEVKPWDKFNAEADAGELLRRHGWVLVSGTEGGELRFSRPGARHREVHAAVNYGGSGKITVYTPNDRKLPAGTYSKFDALVLLEYNGDKAAAAEALKREYGMEQEWYMQRPKVYTIPTPAPRDPNPKGLPVGYDESGQRLFRVMVNRAIVDKGDYKRFVGFYTPAQLTARELGEEIAAGHSVICSHGRAMSEEELAAKAELYATHMRRSGGIPMPPWRPVYWRHSEYFEACDCIGIDIDTPPEASPGVIVPPFYREKSMRCLENLILAYTTHSHTERRPRWRLIFGLTAAISDYETARRLIRAVVDTFGADPACSNPMSNLTGNSRIGRREPGHCCWIYTDGYGGEAL